MKGCVSQEIFLQWAEVIVSLASPLHRPGQQEGTEARALHSWESLLDWQAAATAALFTDVS